MSDQKPKLERCVFEFSQEANCVSKDQFETLTIECESSLGIDSDGGCFYVLKTGPEGWSMDSTNDLQEILVRINKAIKGGKS